MKPEVKSENRSIAEVIARRRVLLTVSAILGVVVSMVSYKYAEKTYKVQTTFSIQTQYFQVPMVQDFVPITYDETELRTQRESLVRQTLDHEYLRDLGTRFKLFAHLKEGKPTSWDLDQLADKFEIVNLNAMTFMVSYRGKDPAQGYQIIQDYTDHLRKTLEADRKSMLVQLRNGIKDQLETLAFGGKNEVGIMSSRPDLVKEEIARVKNELKELKSVYSSKHPRVVEFENRLAKLSKYLEPNDLEKELQKERFSSAKLDPGSEDLFRDLLKKFHYISVVMYMDQQNKDSYLAQVKEPFIPKDPVWPKRPLFLAWGVALGLLTGAVVAFALESDQPETETKPEIKAVLKAEVKVPKKSTQIRVKKGRGSADPRIVVQIKKKRVPVSAKRKPVAPPPFKPRVANSAFDLAKVSDLAKITTLESASSE